MRGSPITAAVAALALVVGCSSAIGGVLNERAADKKVCVTVDQTNASVRGLLDDFLTAPQVTPAQKRQADALALKRFPPQAC